MSKIEELKAAYKAANVADSDVGQMCSEDAEFITLAYDMMPTLLQMVELGWDLAHLCGDSDFADDRRANAIRRKILKLCRKGLR